MQCIVSMMGSNPSPSISTADPSADAVLCVTQMSLVRGEGEVSQVAALLAWQCSRLHITLALDSKWHHWKGKEMQGAWLVNMLMGFATGKQETPDTAAISFFLHGQANQWRVVRARGVEAIVGAMRALREHAMVQLSALLAFIPLALENAMLQVREAWCDSLMRTYQVAVSEEGQAWVGFTYQD